MRTGFLEVPDFAWTVSGVQEKPGSRTEHTLVLSDELHAFGKQLTDLPLKYASLMVAHNGTTDQHFHSDSSSGERAIVYLTDVTEENGPIEFLDYGKVTGKAGTFAHYNATEQHKGCKSDVERYALAMAFDDSDTKITTIGAVQSNDFALVVSLVSVLFLALILLVIFVK
jgi:hypothetical protein